MLRRLKSGHSAKYLREPWFVGVLAAALGLRVATAIAYWPVLMWPDSWAYLISSANLFQGAVPPDKPAGYPLLIAALGRELGAVSLVQHLLGLAGGAVVYVTLRRAAVDTRLAAAAVALVILDAYAIALEQHLLSEAPFTLAMIVWGSLAVRREPTMTSTVLAGGALAAACLLRTAGVFAIPVWLGWMILSRDHRRFVLAASVAAVLPLMAYAGAHASTGRGFGLVAMDGWFLYGRVAEVGECEGRTVPERLRDLCPDGTAGLTAPDPVDWFLWSPASRLAAFGNGYSLHPLELRRANRRLRDFSGGVIRDRPAAVASLVLTDAARLLVPGQMSVHAGYDGPITLPAEAPPVADDFRAASRRTLPGYRTRWPAPVLAVYGRWVHTPRWLLALCIAGALVAVVRRPRGGSSRSAALLVAAGCALIVAGATTHFEPRYVVSLSALFLMGGAMLLADVAGGAGGESLGRLARRVRAGRRARA